MGWGRRSRLRMRETKVSYGRATYYETSTNNTPPTYPSTTPHAQKQVSPLLRASPAGFVEVLRGMLAPSGARGLLTGYWITNAVWLPWNMMCVTK